MAEIIEIMTSKGNGGQKFTVDTSLPPNGQSIVSYGSFETDNTEFKSIFAQGDNIAIVSAGIILPESFILGNIGFGAAPLSSLPKLNIYFYTEPGHIKYYPIIAGSQGNFLLPLENYEYILNNFIDVTKGPFITGGGATVDKIPGNFALYLSVDPRTVKISMVNVPAILNGTVQRITPFVKIIHNIPLIA